MRIRIYTHLIAKKIFCRAFDILLENVIIIIEVGKKPILIIDEYDVPVLVVSIMSADFPTRASVFKMA